MTYFVTYGTAMACYAYFVLTKQDYILPDVKNRQYLLTFHKRAKTGAWDVAKFNSLKEGIYSAERDLKKLRDPLHLRLPQPSLQAAANRRKGAENNQSGILSSQLNIGNLKNMLKEKFS